MLDKQKLSTHLKMLAERHYQYAMTKHEKYQEEERICMLKLCGVYESLLREIQNGDLEILQDKETCKWKQGDNKYRGFFYDTYCGESFSLEGNEKEDKFKFCPYCGKEIEEVKYER